jgi:hypothetical protein
MKLHRLDDRPPDSLRQTPSKQFHQLHTSRQVLIERDLSRVV